jgi:hypothetical protein
MMPGTALYSMLYHRLEPKILNFGDFDKITLPQLPKVRPEPVFIGVIWVIIVCLLILELAGY